MGVWMYVVMVGELWHIFDLSLSTLKLSQNMRLIKKGSKSDMDSFSSNHPTLPTQPRNKNQANHI